jgi:hypothetical protein
MYETALVFSTMQPHQDQVSIVGLCYCSHLLILWPSDEPYTQVAGYPTCIVHPPVLVLIHLHPVVHTRDDTLPLLRMLNGLMYSFVRAVL